ncbi:MAG TPA: multiheme c-type cytochrome [Longimicrobiaceae bacterium]
MPLLSIVLGCHEPEALRLASQTLVGDSTCVACHQEQAEFLGTAHAGTSAPASAETIHGSFAEGENVLRTSNPRLFFRMVQAGGDFFQEAVESSGSDTTRTIERFDIVVGSGRKGQSYLYWRSDLLFQLPISHWTGIGWANSPGYRDGVANFNRPVPPRCLECHSTYAASLPSLGGGNRYDTASLVPGISCQTCHGAGGEHVRWAQTGSVWRWLRSAAIVNPADLPRERRVDGCALCHGGIGESIQPPFSYRPGEPLSAYLHQPEPSPDEPVDVHGNQVALLARSACFQQSDMTCSTCHDVHRPQRDISEFTAVCTSCHVPGESLDADHGAAMPGNCVDCHMPNVETNVIVGDQLGRVLKPRVRSHRIAVYQ